MKKLTIIILALFLTAGFFFFGGCSTGSGGGGGGGTAVTHTVSGTTADPQGTVVSGVTCTLNSTTGIMQTTTSDASGNFSFTGVSEGNYNVLGELNSYISSRYYIQVTSSGATYRATTSVRLVMLTPAQFDSFAGTGHAYDPTSGYIMPLALDAAGNEVGGVSFSSQPSATATGYISNAGGIDWFATSTSAGQGRALLEVTSGPSYMVTPTQPGWSFNPSNTSVTPQQGELTLIQFRQI